MRIKTAQTQLEHARSSTTAEIYIRLALDSIIDSFGSHVWTVRIDEYDVRIPHRRYRGAPFLRVALAEGFQVLSQEIVYTLHRLLRSRHAAGYI